jgi:hypothetical protein
MGIVDVKMIAKKALSGYCSPIGCPIQWSRSSTVFNLRPIINDVPQQTQPFQIPACSDKLNMAAKLHIQA